MTQPTHHSGPYSRRKVLPWADVPVATTREMIAQQVGLTVREDHTLGDIHARFCSKFLCPACGLPAICSHRDRAKDLALILRGETTAQFEITGVCPVEGGEVPDGMTLPVTVQVHYPARIPVPYSHEMCEGLHYRMTREDAQRFGANWEGVFVCEHMGKII